MRADASGMFYLEESDLGQDLVSVINAMQSGTSALLGARERQTYIWANATERDAQRGHTDGALGYQLDTRAEYKFENGRWRLATPHIEYNLKRTLGDGSSFEAIGSGNATVSDAYSSSTDFVQDLGDGFFRIVNPGIYSFSMVAHIEGTASVGTTELVVARANSNKTYAGIVGTGAILADRAYGSVAIPNIRLVTSNNDFGFAISKRTNGDAEVQSTVRITRIG